MAAPLLCGEHEIKNLVAVQFLAQRRKNAWPHSTTAYTRCLLRNRAHPESLCMFAWSRLRWLETVHKVSDVRLSTRFPASHLFTNVEFDLKLAIAMPSLAQTGTRRPPDQDQRPPSMDRTVRIQQDWVWRRRTAGRGRCS
jgi:hypothetical protein